MKGYYSENVNMTCKQCNTSICKTCNYSSSYCTSCYDNYNFLNNTCYCIYNIIILN